MNIVCPVDHITLFKEEYRDVAEKHYGTNELWRDGKLWIV